MLDLSYKRIISEDDVDIPKLIVTYKKPEIVRYISISENYFRYVTENDEVYFYKIYESNKLIGATHIEKQGTTLFMDILVFPEFHRLGLGTKILKDIQDDIFGFHFERIEISIDEKNTASLKLFENAGFIRISKDDELINLTYHKITV